jgi:sulfonate transport system permease protein
VLVLAWGALAASGYFGPVRLPSPIAVWEALTDNLTGPSGLVRVAGRSVLRLAAGMGIAVVAGTLLGLSMAAWGWVQRTVGTVVVGLQSLPPVAWIPLAILWLSFSEGAILFIVVIGAIPAIAIATAASVRQVPPILVRAARTMGARGWPLYREVVLPAAVPAYWTGLQQGWANAWWALLAGELISTGARGLGHLLDRARSQLDTPLLIATMIVIVAIGLVVELVFTIVDRRIRTRRGLTIGGIAIR